jgi:hypothetical protein
MNFADIERAFAIDGSLRDIYVASTNTEDWQRVLDFVPSIGGNIHFSHANVPVLCIPTAIEIFRSHNFSDWCLRFSIDGILVVTHFFAVCELEFDFDPKDIRHQKDLDSLVAFVKSIGELLNKNVLVTRENQRESILLRYDAIENRVIS